MRSHCSQTMFFEKSLLELGTADECEHTVARRMGEVNSALETCGLRQKCWNTDDLAQSPEDAQQSFGEAPRVKLSKPTQSKPKPICDRSGKPEDTERVFVEKGKTSRSQEIDDKRLQKELGSSDRTGKPVKLSEDIRVMHAHDGTGNL